MEKKRDNQENGVPISVIGIGIRPFLIIVDYQWAIL